MTRFPRPQAVASGATLSALDRATGWLNSPPLPAGDLRGRVVLVQFWTYTCINWLRTLPYVRAWAQRYAGDGLVVVGVHTPEFEFERDVDNVRRAVADLRVTYPVALDEGYAVWDGFDNHYWPAQYVVDARGHVRHRQFGEGDYDGTEQVLRRLLAETGTGPVAAPAPVTGSGVEAPADWASMRSAENYLGHGRTDNFASPDPRFDVPHDHVLPADLRLNSWALAGDWTVGRRATVSNRPGGRLAYRFHARDLHLVAAPGAGPVRFRARLDGRPPGDAHGGDLAADGTGTIAEPRLHQLVRQPGPVADRTLELEFLDPGVALHAVTFG